MSDTGHAVNSKGYERYGRGTLLAMLVVFVMIASPFFVVTAGPLAPSISTNKLEYMDGETVYITGHGFTPFERVTIVLTHSDFDPIEYTVGPDPNLDDLMGPDLTGTFVLDSYKASGVVHTAEPVVVTAIQGDSVVATTEFYDPEVSLNLYGLETPFGWTGGDIKGYNEGDSIPSTIILNPKMIGSDIATVWVGADYRNWPSSGLPTYGIEGFTTYYWTEYWPDNTLSSPYNTHSPVGNPFSIQGGTIVVQEQQPNIWIEGNTESLVFRVVIDFDNPDSADSVLLMFGSFLAISDLDASPEKHGAAFYSGSSLQVYMLNVVPGDVDDLPGTSGKKKVPIAQGEIYTAPEMTLAKYCDDGPYAPGSEVTFTVQFSNIGGADAHDLVLWDDLPAGMSLVPGSFVYSDTANPDLVEPPLGIVPTATGWYWEFPAVFPGTHTHDPEVPGTPIVATLTFRGLVVSADVGWRENWVHLTYTSFSGGEFPQLDAWCEFYVAGGPVISVEKTGPEYAYENHWITYNYLVSNIGPVPIEHLYVHDDVAGLVFDGDIFLDVGASISLPKNYQIKPSDPHELVNTVTATGTDEFGRDSTDTDTHTTWILRPAIDVTKTVWPEHQIPGAKVYYTIRVYNPPEGQTDLYGVTLEDTILGTITIPGWDGTLLAGESRETIVDYTVLDVGTGYTNYVTATGLDIRGMEVEDTDDAYVDILHPDIRINKWAEEEHVHYPGTITYWIRIWNPSPDTTMCADVSDPSIQATPLVVDYELGPGAEHLLGPYTVPVPPATEIVTNHATVTADDGYGHVATASDDAEVEVITPSIEVTKTGPDYAYPGTTITYTIGVRNSGDTPLYKVWVTDATIGKSKYYEELQPESFFDVFYWDYDIPEGTMDPSITNTVTATGEDVLGLVVSDSAEWTVDLIRPHLTVVKTGPEYAYDDTDVEYTVTVTNDGDSWIYDIVLTDTLVTVTEPPFDLAPTASKEIKYTYHIPDGYLFDTVLNVATATGTDDLDGTVSDDDDHTVDVINPHLTVVKTGPEYAYDDTDVEYTVTVTNDGDSWIYDIELTDSLVTLDEDPFDLAPGAHADFSYTYHIPDGYLFDTVLNVATATGTDDLDGTVSDDDDHTVDVIDPSLLVEKTGPAYAYEDSDIEYTVTVSNNGDSTVYGIILSDPKMPAPVAPFDLSPGESRSFSYTYHVPDGYVGDTLPNLVTATGEDDLENPVSDDDDHLVDIIRPHITVVKTGPAEAYPGDTITYTVTVTNDGDCTLYTVEVTDSLVGVIGTYGEMAAGFSDSIEYDYTIPDDTEPGMMPNMATATGVDVLQGTVTGSDTWEVEILPFASISGLKWGDNDESGLIEDGEEGIDGWTILLLLPDDPLNPIDTQVTSQGGHYEFTKLKAGSYIVREVMQDGWYAVAPSSGEQTVDVSVGQHKEDVNFGNMATGTLSGHKWFDENMNLEWDPGEDGLEGWTITLTGVTIGGVTIEPVSDVTGPDGSYSFTGLKPGDYMLTETMQPGWFPVTDMTIDLPPLEMDVFDITDLNFGNAAYATITGYKWLDLNMNGNKDGLEPKLPGWEITLYKWNDVTEVWDYYDSAITGPSGDYTFDDLPPGEYRVQETLKPGWMVISPVKGYKDYTVIPGAYIDCAKFGNLPLGKIEGYKFVDWDLDGWFDRGAEHGLAGWTMTLTGYLYDLWNTPIEPRSMDTLAGGYFCFDNLLPGRYTVTEEDGGVMWYSVTGLSETVEIMATPTGATIVDCLLFGNVPKTCIWGYKYEDVNGNGQRDVDDQGNYLEPGLPGWTITITGYLNDEDATPIDPIVMTTDADGYYETWDMLLQTCYILLPGTYTITETSPEDGWTAINPVDGVYVIELPYSDEPMCYQMDFGNFREGKVWGYKYEDMDGDGRYDPGLDVPYEGWTIFIKRPNGDVDSMTTGPDGKYEFTGLLAGHYRVWEEMKDNWASSPGVATEHEFDIASGDEMELPWFFNFEYSRIWGYKWNDLNGDGIWQKPDEPAILRWTMSLMVNGNPVALTDQTDLDGMFEFTMLVPDAFYMVYEDWAILPEGWTPTTPDWEEFSLALGNPIWSGSDVQTQDFGNFKDVTITVFKFDDYWGNGEYDEGIDLPLGSWEFTVTGPGVPGGSTVLTTGDDGKASITVTKGGLYTVTETVQDGWCPTTDEVQSVTVQSGSEPDELRFGNFKCINVPVFKYEDVNGNGRYDEDVDHPYEGWTIYLYDYSGETLVIEEETTDEYGYANFTVCHYGYYEIYEELRDGWCQSEPGSMGYWLDYYSFWGYSGTVLRDFVFGNFDCVDITIFKYEDVNSDGRYDPLVDDPLSGWYFEVYDLDGMYWDYGWTNDDGYLTLEVCFAGELIIEEELQGGYSAINPLSGKRTVDIESGSIVPTQEFGNFEHAWITVFKYEDYDSNGIYDGDDEPIPNWKFTIEGPGVMNDEEYTDYSGYARFEVNRSGEYTLTEEDQDSWTHVNPADGDLTVDIVSGDYPDRLEFGNFEDVTVRFYKFDDRDGYGYWDYDEALIDGWLFSLYKWDPEGGGGGGAWVFVESKTTVNGYVEFVITSAGKYKVCEEDRTDEGWFWIWPVDGYVEFQVTSGAWFQDWWFANFKLGKITGYKYNDINGNGELDQGEPGLPGWNIYLYGELEIGGETYIWDPAPAVTDENGYYEFYGLPPGYYDVWEELSEHPGWIVSPGTPSAYYDIEIMGHSEEERNFFNFELGCIKGWKYEDVNGNGQYDQGLDTPEAWTFYLYDESGALVGGPLLTGDDGYFEFCGVGPGDYTVSEERRIGWCPTNDPDRPVTMTSGAQIDLGVFLNFQCVYVDVFKYEDVNSNGEYDGDDGPRGGWVMRLEVWDEDAQSWVLDESQPTDGFGEVQFEICSVGTYRVVEVLEDGWTPINPLSGMSDEFTVQSGSQVPMIEFGNFENVWINVFKYEDAEGDGHYVPVSEGGKDKPKAHWSFTISGPGVINPTDETDQYGYVHFEVNRSGEYTITEEDRAGWTHVEPADGELGAEVESGAMLADLMFGNFNNINIRGMKLHDWDRNHIMSDLDEALEGWVVVLTGGDLIEPLTTSTNSLGEFEFLGLGPGTYTVTESFDGRPGWVPMSATFFVVEAESGVNSEGNVFLNVLYGEICGYKFHDKDGDGVRDYDDVTGEPLEPGLEGWTITLTGTTNAGEDVDREETTLADGSYCFEDVQPGLYELNEELPDDSWTPTTALPIEVDVHEFTNEFIYDEGTDIGNIRYGKVWGYKFLDTYQDRWPFWPNGKFDDDEIGLGSWHMTLEGWTYMGEYIQLSTDTSNALSPGDPPVGYYEFGSLLPGTYWVNETKQRYWVATTPWSVVIDIVPFTWGQVVFRQDFGNILPTPDPELRFVLKSGANLWSSPLKMTSPLKASQLAAKIGPSFVKVSRFDTTLSKYQAFALIPGTTTPIPGSVDFEVKQGEGYFVMVSGDSAFTLIGDLVPNTSVTLGKGTNIVGYNKLTPMKASELASLVSGTTVTKISYFDPVAKKYRAYSPILPINLRGEDFTVTEGRAYFVMTSSTGGVLSFGTTL
ncbi:MAG TPA: SdrD B-like domain-containing protein [Thermoplasmata archaeon]